MLLYLGVVFSVFTGRTKASTWKQRLRTSNRGKILPLNPIFKYKILSFGFQQCPEPTDTTHQVAYGILHTAAIIAISCSNSSVIAGVGNTGCFRHENGLGYPFWTTSWHQITFTCLSVTPRPSLVPVSDLHRSEYGQGGGGLSSFWMERVWIQRYSKTTAALSNHWPYCNVHTGRI